ncbi:MAG TPA: hypothetical protein VGO52_26665 [Hyphomonadaceae bacterium]|nr:hypothetical protein [Hyphomonadaceae bacterium]
MSTPMSRSSKPEKQRAQKPKSAAQRASEANRAQQVAIRENAPRPNDRTVQGEHDTLLKPKR